MFAVTAALEFAAAQRHQAGFVLSEEYLNWASNDAMGEFEDGGFFKDLWLGYQKHGACEARLAPYLDAFDPEWRPGRAAKRQAHSFRMDRYELEWIKHWDVTTGLSDEELEAVLRTVHAGWPVCVGLRWPKEPVWENGVLGMCPEDQVFDGHSVLFVGFAIEHAEPLTGTIVFKDSGSGGRYASMPLEFARCYANDAAVITE